MHCNIESHERPGKTRFCRQTWKNFFSGVATNFLRCGGKKGFFKQSKACHEVTEKCI